MPETPPSPLPEDNQRWWWRKIWPRGATFKYKATVATVGIVCVLLAIVTGVIVAKIIHKEDVAVQTAGQNKHPENKNPNSPEAENTEEKPADDVSDDKPAEPPKQTGSAQQQANGGTGGNPANNNGGNPGGGTGGTGNDGGNPGSGNSCALPNYPDETCTGVPAGTVLTVVNGDLEIETDGTVVDGKDIRGCVIVQAANVTIRNSKITCTSFYGIASYLSSDAGGLLVEDVEIDCANNNTTGLSYQGTVARRVHIHGCENGLDILSNVTLEDSYIHDIYEGATGHGDGIQSPNGSDSSIIHNTIYAESTTAAININHDSNGPTTSNVTISNNLLAGGAYTMYCPIKPTNNFKITNNHFSRIFYPTGGAFGVSTDCHDEQQSGNVWHDSGLPLNLN